MEHLFRSPDGGTTWEVLDRPVRFENWLGDVSYRGKWRVLRDAAFSTGTASGASQPGSAAVLHFVGKQVRWIGMRGPRQGVAKVLIDGELVGTVDQYAEIPAFSVTSFVSSNLAPGSHSISVEVTDARRTRSPVGDIVVDAFDVT
jgi:glucosylceramidase